MNYHKTTIYQPDNQIKKGFVSAWKEIVRSLYSSRELIWRLFIRDFLAKYKQSLFGLTWTVLNPLITVGIFVYLNKAGLFNIGKTNIPYPAFALVGLSVWTLFATGLSACSSSIINAGPMIVKINFPRASLVISSMGQAIVDFIVRILITAIVFIAFKVVPFWTIIFLPLAVIPIILLTLGIGFFLSLLTGVFRDIPNAVNLITTFLLFLVPVLYPAPESGLFATINSLNPLSQIIIGCRDLVFVGRLTSPVGFFGSSVFSIVIFLVFLRFFYLVETKIAERI